jgi:hypothetical protein
MNAERFGRSIWQKALPLLLVLLVLLVAHFIYYLGREEARPLPEAGMDPVSAEAAYADRLSGVWIEVHGEVTRLLEDDSEGSPHQRFILRLDGGNTLLVVHNLDLAERVPVTPGDRVSLRGRYEWNDRGGVVHWTHHDPAGVERGGWIEYDGGRVR